MDFVEEDLSRKLPASERINHTLLALNYGAILVLLLPVLVGWAAQPTAIVRRPIRAAGAWLAALARARRRRCSACAISRRRGARRGWRAGRRRGARRGAARPRSTSWSPARPASSASRLVEALAGAGHRRDRAGARSGQGRGAAAAVHARHEPRPDRRRHADRRHRQSRRRADRQRPVDAAPSAAASSRSRLRMTRDVVRLIARLERKPGRAGQRLGDRLVRAVAGRGADGVRQGACLLQPRALRRLGAGRASGRPRIGVRVVCLRIGLVLGTEGGFLARLLTPFEFGLGGPIGSGRQWMSWIERDDLVRLIAHVHRHARSRRARQRDRADPGPQREFTEELGAALQPARDLPHSRRAAAPHRRRSRRRAAARRPARAAEQGDRAAASSSATRRCAARSRRSCKEGVLAVGGGREILTPYCRAAEITSARIRPSIAPLPKRCASACSALSVAASNPGAPRVSISLRQGVPWQ